jgi:hypothetical protein
MRTLGVFKDKTENRLKQTDSQLQVKRRPPAAFCITKHLHHFVTSLACYKLQKSQKTNKNQIYLDFYRFFMLRFIGREKSKNKNGGSTLQKN